MLGDRKTTVSSQQGNSSSIKMNIQMLFRKRCSRTRAGAASAVHLLSSGGHRGQWDISSLRAEVWGWFLSSSPSWETVSSLSPLLWLRKCQR